MPIPGSGQGSASTIDQLLSGIAVLSLGVRHARTPEIARLAAGAGYGVLWVDLEHSTMPIDTAAAIAAAAADLGIEGWVRVPERDYGVIGRLLDGGATGIIIPKIETAEEARFVAGACRFAPVGQRSQIARLPQFNFASLPDLAARANARTTVQILIESPKGIANVDAIAAVDGVDMLALGLNDFTAEIGCPGKIDHPDVQQACAAMVAAATRHGKLAVIGGVGDPERIPTLLEAGFAPLIFAAIDTDVIATGLTQRASDWASRLST